MSEKRKDAGAAKPAGGQGARNPASAAPLPRLAKRPADSHKGDFGRALLIGGSRGMTGAIALAGMAALRGGAGLVRLAVPDCCLGTVASFEPSLMTAPLPCDVGGRIAAAARSILEELLAPVTAVGCGPGLSRSAELDRLVAWLYTRLPQPAVFDADALNALATQPDVLRRPGGPRVLTPHPGEFGRLSGDNELKSREALEERAASLAGECGVVIVLKGHRSLVTDGTQRSHNATGNPGMATGGTGDVLTGIVTALLCQGLAPYNAARLGAHVHGLAGDLAATELGEVSLIASDLVRFLPRAIQTVADS
ncbi:MAG: NAD(P)H-hydrate dehydratase [Planctomycetia bacterium]|nr:NAD(P)H-hydrate dehydratase [Planctomycetia bacterium]